MGMTQLPSNQFRRHNLFTHLGVNASLRANILTCIVFVAGRTTITEAMIGISTLFCLHRDAVSSMVTEQSERKKNKQLDQFCHISTD